jgi:hypothetical protein
MQVKQPEFKNVKRNYTWGKRRVAFHRLINLFVSSAQNPYGFIRGVPVYSRTARELKYLTLRRLLVRYGVIDSYDRLIDMFDNKFIDKKGICKQILAECLEDNRRIEQEYGIKLRVYGYLDGRG